MLKQSPVGDKGPPHGDGMHASGGSAAPAPPCVHAHTCMRVHDILPTMVTQVRMAKDFCAASLCGIPFRAETMHAASTVAQAQKR